MTKNNFINVIDFEATCLEDNSKLNVMQEIIQIGICKIDMSEVKSMLALEEDRKNELISGHLFYVKPEYSRSVYVKPEYNGISEFCTNLTGIKQSDVNSVGNLSNALNLIKKKYSLKNNPIVQWGNFDSLHLKKECEHKGIEYPFNLDVINLKKLYAIKRCLKRDVGLKEALDNEGMKFIGQQHNAYYDAINTAMLFINVMYL